MKNLNSECTCTINSSILSNTDILCKIEEMENKEILKQYGKSIWYSEKENCWYCHIPDSTKREGRKKVKRKKQSDIEKVVCDYYRNESKQSKNQTFEELFLEFIEYKKLKVTASTIRRMLFDWKKYYTTIPEFIHKPFREITKVDVDKFLNTILSNFTIKDKNFCNMRGIMKQVFNYAVDCEYIEKSPYRVDVNKKKIIPTHKKDNNKEIFLPNEQIAIIEEMERRLKNNPTNTAPLAVMLDFELGIRQGEMLAIRESNIQNGMIHICEQVVSKFNDSNIDDIKREGFEAVEYTKSDAGDRWLPLTDKAKELIERVKDVNKKYNMKYKDYLFVRENHLFTPSTLDAQLVHGCKYIGIPIKRMHKIRKTYASTLYKHGVSIPVISKMLGHADESTTMKHYIFSLDDNTETNQIVLNALQGNTNNEYEKVTTGDQNIISFTDIKKAGNPYKSKVSH